MTAAHTAQARAADAPHARPMPNEGAGPLLWLDGRRADASRPAISAFDRGFTLADGVFETMRAYRGRVFRADRHLARLAAGAAVLGIPVPQHVAETIDAAADTLRALDWPDAALRLTLSRGAGPRGLAPDAAAEPVTVLTVHALPPREPLAALGVRVRTSAGRRNEFAPTAGVKTLAYTDAVVALAQARAAGADDALLLDTAGHLSEATASNLVLVRGSTLRTPPLACGVLPGITRAAILELASAIGLDAREEVLLPHDLAAADEAFLTSSVRELSPIARADDREMPNGAPGPVTARVADAFAALVDRECRA
ncbi:MAG TPA: aminotransferase class IV [Gemmatimonadaceae bacterium]